MTFRTRRKCERDGGKEKILKKYEFKALGRKLEAASQRIGRIQSRRIVAADDSDECCAPSASQAPVAAPVAAQVTSVQGMLEKTGWVSPAVPSTPAEQKGTIKKQPTSAPIFESSKEIEPLAVAASTISSVETSVQAPFSAQVASMQGMLEKAGWTSRVMSTPAEQATTEKQPTSTDTFESNKDTEALIVSASTVSSGEIAVQAPFSANVASVPERAGWVPPVPSTSAEQGTIEKQPTSTNTFESNRETEALTVSAATVSSGETAVQTPFAAQVASVQGMLEKAGWTSRVPSTPAEQGTIETQPTSTGTFESNKDTEALIVSASTVSSVETAVQTPFAAPVAAQVTSMQGMLEKVGWMSRVMSTPAEQGTIKKQPTSTGTLDSNKETEALIVSASTVSSEEAAVQAPFSAQVASVPEKAGWVSPSPSTSAEQGTITKQPTSTDNYESNMEIEPLAVAASTISAPFATQVASMHEMLEKAGWITPAPSISVEQGTIKKQPTRPDNIESNMEIEPLAVAALTVSAPFATQVASMQDMLEKAGWISPVPSTSAEQGTIRKQPSTSNFETIKETNALIVSASTVSHAEMAVDGLKTVWRNVSHKTDDGEYVGSAASFRSKARLPRTPKNKGSKKSVKSPTCSSEATEVASAEPVHTPPSMNTENLTATEQ